MNTAGSRQSLAQTKATSPDRGTASSRFSGQAPLKIKLLGSSTILKKHNKVPEEAQKASKASINQGQSFSAGGPVKAGKLILKRSDVKLKEDW